MSNMVRKQTISLARDASVSSIHNSSIAPTGEGRYRNRLQIEALLQRFNEVNSHIDPNIDQKNFNLINYQHEDQKIKYDPQMMAAKLRKLQNRAQINRAQREIQNREKKKNKKFNVHKTKQATQNYKTIYKNFLKNNKLSQDFQDFSDEESVENKNKPMGVAYFTQLKRHPVLLEYTLKKINSKQKTEEDKLKKLQNTLTKFKKNNNQIPKQYKDIVEDFNNKLSQLSQNNPENIIQTRFSKFYSKKSCDKLSKQIVKNPRCSKMIQKQNQIVSQISERSLSKQNKQKLKSRLNQIINSISKSQKMSNFVLPKLNSGQKEQEKKQ